MKQKQTFNNKLMQEVTYFTQKVHEHHTWHKLVNLIKYKAGVRVTRWGNSLPVGKMKNKIGKIVLSLSIRLTVQALQIWIYATFTPKNICYWFIFTVPGVKEHQQNLDDTPWQGKQHACPWFTRRTTPLDGYGPTKLTVQCFWLEVLVLPT